MTRTRIAGSKIWAKSHLEMASTTVYAEASTIGLAPGEWPEQLDVCGDSGRRYLFNRFETIRNAEDEFVGVTYEHIMPSGRIVSFHVYND